MANAAGISEESRRPQPEEQIGGVEAAV